MDWGNREEVLEYHRRYNEAHKKPCPKCGKPIDKRSEHCRKCKAMPTGNKATNWRGGRILNHPDGNGYYMLMRPNHHRANKSGYVLEHIVIWETYHNKKLPDGWIIHHLNGIRTDNRPQNLVALPSQKHFQVLGAKAKRIQELEALLNYQGVLL